MKKFVMGVVLSSKTHKVILFAAMLGSLALIEVITYRETTQWLTAEFTSIIQEDNSFFQ